MFLHKLHLAYYLVSKKHTTVYCKKQNKYQNMTLCFNLGTKHKLKEWTSVYLYSGV